MSYTALTHGPPLPAKAAEYLQQREAVNRFREEAYSGLSSTQFVYWRGSEPLEGRQFRWGWRMSNVR